MISKSGTHNLDPDSSMYTIELDEERPRTFSEEELDIETVKILQREHNEKISLDADSSLASLGSLLAGAFGASVLIVGAVRWLRRK